MIDYHRFCQIKHLHAHQGLNASQIAKAWALDPRTVAYWLAQEPVRPQKPRQRPSKLAPFKQEIVRLLEHYPCSAAQVFQRLSEPGFDGGYAIVKAYGRIGCASTLTTSSLPAMPEATSGTKTAQTPITPRRSWSTAKKPASTSSSCAFSRSRLRRRPIPSSLRSGA